MRVRSQLRPQLEHFTEEHPFDVESQECLFLQRHGLDASRLDVSVRLKVAHLHAEPVHVEVIALLRSVFYEVAPRLKVVVQNVSLDLHFFVRDRISFDEFASQWVSLGFPTIRDDFR